MLQGVATGITGYVGRVWWQAAASQATGSSSSGRGDPAGCRLQAVARHSLKRHFFWFFSILFLLLRLAGS